MCQNAGVVFTQAMTTNTIAILVPVERRRVMTKPSRYWLFPYMVFVRRDSY